MNKYNACICLDCGRNYQSRGTLNRHLETCQQTRGAKIACRVCPFCAAPESAPGAPRQAFFRDAHVCTDHVLNPNCWSRIDEARRSAHPRTRLATLLAPTRANFERVRDSRPACTTSYNTDRHRNTRRYDDDDTPHNTALSQAQGQILYYMYIRKITLETMFKTF